MLCAWSTASFQQLKRMSSILTLCLSMYLRQSIGWSDTTRRCIKGCLWYTWKFTFTRYVSYQYLYFTVWDVFHSSLSQHCPFLYTYLDHPWFVRVHSSLSQCVIHFLVCLCCRLKFLIYRNFLSYYTNQRSSITTGSYMSFLYIFPADM